jgi:septal ring factor EnvC (AmiA/AmiB activator)
MASIETRLAEVRTEVRNLRETVDRECAARAKDHDALTTLRVEMDNLVTLINETAKALRNLGPSIQDLTMRVQAIEEKLKRRMAAWQQWFLVAGSALLAAAATLVVKKLFGG